ncbi:hypothetical protein CR513_34021, partial [Mucuna pruriens]
MRTMILRENGEVESESSSKETSSSESSYSSEEAHYEGDLLMSRCLILGKFCSLIIDGGSSVNIASLRLIEKLYIPTLSNLVSLAIILGKYKDEILCNVVPMEETHIDRFWLILNLTFNTISNAMNIRARLSLILE